ncbi:MAG: type I DNA topoisomerase [Propioniciclava sp.]|uniref:type I DNA topoisomerase n=1 Tax=Propioniciclava sp. TaxID=2038686 RepID=UPI0039E5027D
MATDTKRRLVIVESPGKVRSLTQYLGDGYLVEASIGHVRDLPTGAAEVPAKYKGQKWARTGVDVDNDFEPLYVVQADKKATIRKLKEALKTADELYLATDEDREGEAIAWHLLQELKPKVPVKRMVFHEITPEAIRAAVASPRELDVDLVDAQETRRILDRLYGYEVSPVLWKKVMPRLSAGRVQSVATRLVVDRERERMAFRSASYADLEVTLDAGPDATPSAFTARMASAEGRKVAAGRDFNSVGALTAKNALHLDLDAARLLADAFTGAGVVVDSVEAKPYTRRPYAPFRTTTLQQDAGRKLGFTAQRTMSVAQSLYEGGFITYMRTDSTTLAASAVEAARAKVVELYGAAYLPERPRTYASKVKNAQEAHEAIRPSGEFRTPEASGLRGDELRLYDLIWKRTLASQMKDAEGQTVTIAMTATPTATVEVTDASSGEIVPVGTAGLTASGRTITFAGFLKAYVVGIEEGDTSDDATANLPALTAGQSLDVAGIEAQGHETRPPARYTEPSLVAKMEELEIGRPSTYASIIRTITARDYVFKKGSALVPTWLAFAVTRLLEEHFSRLVDYQFTAGMEDMLDEIAAGNAKRVETLKQFYFGGEGYDGLEKLVGELGDIDARALSTFAPVGGEASGIAVRVGRYGTYVEDAEGNRANVDEDLPPDELTVEKARELLATPSGAERELGLDEASGHPIVARNGRFGPYVTEVLPEGSPKSAKPRTASLFKDMSLDGVTLEDALKLLSLPRVVGSDAEGVEITAQNGRYGPYLKKGTDSRSLENEDELFTVTLEQAEAIFAQPKARGRRAAAGPLKELGADPVSGKPVVVKDGRFGPYVTDGEFNATLRKADSVEAITLERAAELLAEKRAKGPAPKRTTRRAATKTTTKTTTRKTATKK